MCKIRGLTSQKYVEPCKPVMGLYELIDLEYLVHINNLQFTRYDGWDVLRQFNVLKMNIFWIIVN